MTQVEFEERILELKRDKLSTREQLDMYETGLRFAWRYGYQGTQPEFQALIALDYCVAGKVKIVVK